MDEAGPSCLPMDRFNLFNSLKHSIFPKMSFPVSLERVTLLRIFIWNTH